MNHAQSLTHEADGRGLRWMAHHVYAWLNPGARKISYKNVEFCNAVSILVTDFPQSLHQIYEKMPAQFRTREDYRNLESQLRRMTKDGRAVRIGSSGQYRYGTIKNGTI